MKRNICLFAVAFLLYGFSFGQSLEEETDYMQSIFGMGKKALVSDFIQVQGEAGEAFWILYDEYETARKDFGKQRIDLLMAYAMEYGSMDDAELDAMIKAMMKQKKGLDKLIDQYYKKILKQTGATEAAQFYQIENYILSAIRLYILDEIPFIGELQ